MNKKQVLVFDFDGTIADSVAVMTKIISELAEKYKFKKIKNVEAAELLRMGTERMVEVLEIPKESLAKIMEEIRQRLSANMNEIEPVQGIGEALETLNLRGYTMFIVTSNQKENVEILLKKFGIKNIQGIYPEAGLHGKEQLLTKLITDHGFNKSEVVYIGDETRDIKAGKACGCKTMAVTWGLNGKAALAAEKPDWIIDNTMQLLEIFG